jgi:hypothetical protein
MKQYFFILDENVEGKDKNGSTKKRTEPSVIQSFPEKKTPHIIRQSY